MERKHYKNPNWWKAYQLATTIFVQPSLMVNRSAFADVDFAMSGTSSRSRLLKLWKSKFNNSSSVMKNGVVLLVE